MRELTNNELGCISGGGVFHSILNKMELIENIAPDWHVVSIAGGLFLLTTALNMAATVYARPNIPMWGAPVSISLGLGICGAAWLIGQGVDWMSSSTPTYVFKYKG